MKKTKTTRKIRLAALAALLALALFGLVSSPAWGRTAKAGTAVMADALPQEGMAKAPAEETEAAAEVSANPITYQVQDGETLYSICLKVYGSLSRVGEVCELNGLENPDKIISGQKLILP